MNKRTFKKLLSAAQLKKMKPNPRITSILQACTLDSSITNLPTFHLSNLNIEADLNFQLPNNLRLGHLAEKIVSQLIKASTNYNILYENIQLIEDKKTIGEIDFIIEKVKTKEVIHMELAYKFYLYDPSISSEPINNWIGPNRNDSLKEKLEKVKNKQFPLLGQLLSFPHYDKIEIGKISQALCLLASLFIPYEYNGNFNPAYQKAIKGYYLKVEEFLSFDHSEKSYYLPSKREWGMNPAEHDIWMEFEEVEKEIKTSIQQKKAPLVWREYEGSFLAFFIVWWELG